MQFGRIERLKNWIESLRRVGGVELPDEGRSSVEGNLGTQLSGALNQFAGLQPELSFEYLELLKQFVVWHPLMKQFRDNWRSLGNTGHQITINTPNEQAAERVMQRIGETSERIAERWGGIDGLINQYFLDLAWAGAISAEDEVNFAARRVERVHIVPVEQIRFTWDGEKYLPNQLPKIFTGATNKNGLIPLNAETYKYYPLETVGNSPYALPPASAALEDLIGPYADGKDNLKAILKKFGLLGFVAVQSRFRRMKTGESDEEYHKQARAHLTRVRDALKNVWANGLVVGTQDQTIEHHSIGQGATGVENLWQQIEAQVFNGFAMQPAFFGRVHSTTETFADVVFALLDAQVSNVRRLPKRRLESTYRLDLRLAGMQADGLSVNFNATPSRNALQDAQAQEVKVRTVLAKIEAQLISPDQGAQELGYDAAFDPEFSSVAAQMRNPLHAGAVSQFAATFRFNRSAQRYQFVPPTVVMSAPVGAESNVVSFQKKKIV